jgi:hypothetical protein
MKKIYFSFIGIGMSVNYIAQKSINIENEVIRINVNANGNSFDNSKMDTIGFNFPKNSAISTMFSNGFWLGGTDPSGVLKLASSRNNISDFTFGPYAQGINPESWNKVFMVTKTEIDAFIANGTITPSITNWPANGDLSLGHANNLAPFFDSNSDGVYTVQEGDYPLIKGDVCAYIIQNDRTIHQNSGSIQIGLELHTMVYLYHNSPDPAIANTAFVYYQVFNRGATTLQNVFAGTFNDFSIGNNSNELMNTYVQNGMMYAYNGNTNEPDNNANYSAMGAILLQGLRQNPDNIDNPLSSTLSFALNSIGICYPNLGIGYGDGIVDNELIGMTRSSNFDTDNLVNDLDYYNLLKGRDKTGMQNDACNAIFQADSVCSDYTPSLFAQVKNSDPIKLGTNGNSFQCNTCDLQTISNVKGVISSGPITLIPEQSVSLEFAYTVAKAAPSNDSQASVDSLIAYAARLHSSYRNNTVALKSNKLDSEFAFFPNPVNTQLALTFPFASHTVKIMDLNGKVLIDQAALSDRHTIDVSKLLSGVYLIQVDSKTKRFVKL